MKEKMILVCQNSCAVKHDLCTRRAGEICWVDEKGDVRVPRENHKERRYPGLFTAAGKLYTSMKDLWHRESETRDLYYDVHGRQVLCMAELFPCFDSYDYMNETRHYRWCFIKENGKLTRVYHSDTMPTIEITEDVCQVENDCLERMRELGWLEKDA